MSEFRCEYLDRVLREPDMASTNVVSALHLSFINCYVECLERRCDPEVLERYVSIFSRTVVADKLRWGFRCDKIRGLLRNALSYVYSVVDGLRKADFNVFVLRGELTSRLTIHTRSPQMPLEIGLAWDPYMNLPYIPASSIKGVVGEYFRRNNVKIGDYTYTKLLGTTEMEGLIVFHDSYPVECKDELIHPEVLTPHYIEHEGRIDEVNVRPRPLTYPTVAPGTVFYIPIALSKELKLDINSTNELIDKIAKALENGIGAKTSVGYGYMKVTRA